MTEAEAREKGDVARQLLDSGDLPAALALYLQLDAAGCRTVAASIGWIYDNQANRDVALAIHYYEAATEVGDAYAWQALGALYRETGDIGRAFHALGMAAENGRPECYILLYRLLRRHGPDEDAERTLARGADAGEPFAVTVRAHRLMRGQFGLARMPGGLIAWLRSVPAFSRAFVDRRRSGTM